MGRRTAATGDSAPAGGLSSGDAPPIASSQSPLSSVSACGENCARSLAPPFPTARGAAGAPFRSCPKRKRAVHGPKEKGAKRAPVQWPSARDGGRRIGACADLAWPSGTLDPSAIPATTVPWRIVRRVSGCKDAFDQLLFPRVPLRYALPWRSWGRVPHRTESLPRSRRGRCLHRPAGTGLCCCAPAWRSWGAAYSTAWSQPRTSRWRG